MVYSKGFVCRSPTGKLFRLLPAHLNYLFAIKCSQWKFKIRKTVPAMCNQTHMLMKSKSCQAFLLNRGEAVFNTCLKVHFCKLVFSNVFLSVSLNEPHTTVLRLLDMDGWIREIECCFDRFLSAP